MATEKRKTRYERSPGDKKLAQSAKRQKAITIVLSPRKTHGRNATMNNGEVWGNKFYMNSTSLAYLKGSNPYRKPQFEKYRSTNATRVGTDVAGATIEQTMRATNSSTGKEENSGSQ